MDTGPIYVQEEMDISPDDSTTTLLHKLGVSGSLAILELLKVIGKTKAVPQPTSGISLAPKISKEMGRISWKDSAEKILRTARALADRPGIYTQFRGEKIALHGLSESLTPNNLQSIGEIAADQQGLLVRCLDSILLISEVTPSGKKRMSAVDFLRGARLEIAEAFSE